jgi:cell division protein FtsI/penicillin-binding protein 2
MYQLQILDSERYTLLADENRISLRLIAPVRGRILDRFGIALAKTSRIIISSSSPSRPAMSRRRSTRSVR